MPVIDCRFIIFFKGKYEAKLEYPEGCGGGGGGVVKAINSPLEVYGYFVEQHKLIILVGKMLKGHTITTIDDTVNSDYSGHPQDSHLVSIITAKLGALKITWFLVFNRCFIFLLRKIILFLQFSSEKSESYHSQK